MQVLYAHLTYIYHFLLDYEHYSQGLSDDGRGLRFISKLQGKNRVLGLLLT